MSEFLCTVAKGIQWPLFVLAILGIVFKKRQKKWNLFDSYLLGIFVLFEILTAFQVLIFYGKLQTSSRYLLGGIIFYLPFAAYGLIEMFKNLKKNRFVFLFGIVTLSGYICINAYNIYSPIIKDYSAIKHQRKRILVLKASEIIRNDWNERHTAPILALKCDVYQSGKRPLVESRLGQIGYLAGGQGLSDFLKYSNYKPDYVVSEKNSCPAGYYLIGKISYKKDDIFIYKIHNEDTDEL